MNGKSIFHDEMVASQEMSVTPFFCWSRHEGCDHPGHVYVNTASLQFSGISAISGTIQQKGQHKNRPWFLFFTVPIFS